MKWLFRLALLMLAFTVTFGAIAFYTYINSNFLIQSGGFKVLRPMHVSSAIFWIIIGASAIVYYCIEDTTEKKISIWYYVIQIFLWTASLLGIFYSYLNQQFGGREYWEYPPIYSIPIALSMLSLFIRVLIFTRERKTWPVYYWMWLTGSMFFLFTYAEGYLYLLPDFKEYFIKDLSVQWKANGSLVGAWNQLLYGGSFYLMDKMAGNRKTGESPIAYGMYLLGFTNLCFNWGHHIYPLPTHNWIKHLGYCVSMTEWIILLRLIYLWRKTYLPEKNLKNNTSYWFLLSAEYWVSINLLQALLMSIPAINKYTHGTHITVAHAMGSTIGINSSILIAFIFAALNRTYNPLRAFFKCVFFLFHAGLFLLWISLIIAGIKKGIWIKKGQSTPFSTIMHEMHPYFISGLIGGILLSIAILILILVNITFKKDDLNHEKI